MSGTKWDQRIRRARELAATHAFAAQGLRFYEQVASFQQTLYASFEGGGGALAPAPQPRPAGPPGALRAELQPLVLLPWFASFLAFLLDVAPPPLAQAAAELSARGGTHWEEVLWALWRAGVGAGVDAQAAGEGLSAAETLIAWAFLQPYAEHLADHAEPLPADGTPDLCPRCGGRPQVGVLRPLGDGAKRSLICALCATEWGYRRLVCPACGEEDVDKLPIYVAPELAHIRVEACDTCHHYLKTVDLSRNGRAVPVVDELAAIPLSLWAAEHGYAKLATNLLGI